MPGDVDAIAVGSNPGERRLHPGGSLAGSGRTSSSFSSFASTRICATSGSLSQPIPMMPSSQARRISRLLGLGAVLFGLIDLAILAYPSFVQSIAVGLALFVLVGIPAAGMLAGLQTLLQTSAADRFRGRVWGACSRASGSHPGCEVP
jgi:hypothetical protein